MITKEAIEAATEELMRRGEFGTSAEASRKYAEIAAKAAITAAFAAMPAPAVRVKPLEWRLEDERDADFPRWNAEWNGIVFSVFKAWWGSKSKWGFVGGGDFHHTEEAAKDAAQADYEDRILSALTPAPDLAAENERLMAALEVIVKGDVLVHDEELHCDVTASMSEDEMRVIAKAALERT